jgi:hypothetical protein
MSQLTHWGRKVWDGALGALGLGDKGGIDVKVTVPGITSTTPSITASPPNYVPYMVIGAAIFLLFAVRK